VLAIKGNKQIEISRKDLLNLISGYQNVILDLGTGDGRFVYKSALENKDNFWIGLDPSEKQLSVYSRKAVRKNLQNVLFIVGSIENLPNELKNSCQKIFVVLPWGTLLQKTVLPTKTFLKQLNALYKGGHELEIILGFSPDLEPSETERLNLPEISLDYLEKNLLPKYEKADFRLRELSTISKEILKTKETTWSKKLAFAKPREIFLLRLY
jgi:16S rRNA (adenine(1408)-N(1))-methyltransferase